MKEPHASEHPGDSPDSQDSRRFGGVQRVYGAAGVARIRNSHVCVIGVGGVGSWAVESLARSGIGSITMIDMDIVSASNINRQLHATSSTLGRDKVLVMQERVAEINPACRVAIVDDFIAADNVSDYIQQHFDFVVDCIDDFRTKAAIIAHCRQNGVNIITTGGAGGQIDPGRVEIADLSRTRQDVLLARTRKLLRQEFGFTRDPHKRFHVPCVYSDEQLVYPDGDGGLSSQRPAPEGSAGCRLNALNCAGGIGSVAHVTATFGLFATGFVLRELAHAS
ncbi:MAG: tRNA threonylcarbamoyladenosine dehydratase [Gammaproteobacteria bacterium]|nr:tRNA threonylcarbamoyladenosine dehydratase [Gammaproteobacteria bacterium]